MAPEPLSVPRPWLLAALLVVTAPAAAGEGWGGSVAATSRDVFRGLLQRGDAAAVQVDLHRRSEDGWFIGAWLSNGPDPSRSYGRRELNLYAGLGTMLGERLELLLRAVHYRYPDSRLSSRYDYDEVAASLAWEDWLVCSVVVTPNLTRYGAAGLAENKRSLAFEVALRQTLWGPLAATATAGYYDTEALFGTGYRAWSLGLVARLGPAELALTGFRTDGAARRLFNDNTADRRWAATLAWSF